MSGQAHCRSCGAAVTWGQTANGKRAPFNVSDGQNHFIDCAQRRQWRKSEPSPARPAQLTLLDAPAAPGSKPTPASSAAAPSEPDAAEIQRQRTAYLESRYEVQRLRGEASRKARGDG